MTPEKEVLDLEKKYWKALKDKDINAALQMTDDPCIVTGAQGVDTIDHKAYTGMMKNANWELKDFELGDDAQVRMVRDDVAIVAYKVKESLTVDGKPVTLEAADSSTWIKKGGRWVCAMHSEAIAGDPFGRDRRMAT